MAPLVVSGRNLEACMWAFFIAVAELTSLHWVKILISCEFPGISLGISLFQNAGNIKFPLSTFCGTGWGTIS